MHICPNCVNPTTVSLALAALWAGKKVLDRLWCRLYINRCHHKAPKLGRKETT
jgi:hypothetical protein